MNCLEIQARLHAYVDGELEVSDIVEVDGHCLECRSAQPW
jgi:anti-sigma factor RsiW